jgi:hypothetical protein
LGGYDDDDVAGPFFRPESNHGWAGPSGGAKAFVVRLSMPQYTGPAGGFYNNAPAFWILNAKIVHTAQFGCNCRGTGPKGCGEFDVLEVLPDGDLGVATSTIYSFRGAIGGGSNAFARPASVRVMSRVNVSAVDHRLTSSRVVSCRCAADHVRGDLRSDAGAGASAGHHPR